MSNADVVKGIDQKERLKPPCYGSPRQICVLKTINLGFPDYVECRECIEKHHPKYMSVSKKTYQSPPLPL